MIALTANAIVGAKETYIKAGFSAYLSKPIEGTELEKMLTLYCNNYEDRIVKLTEAFRKEDWDNYTVYAHGLKSTSLNIGGEVVSKAAKELEDAGKILRESKQDAKSIAFIKEHHDYVLRLYSATVEEAKNICNNSESISMLKE